MLHLVPANHNPGWLLTFTVGGRGGSGCILKYNRNVAVGSRSLSTGKVGTLICLIGIDCVEALVQIGAACRREDAELSQAWVGYTLTGQSNSSGMSADSERCNGGEC